MRTNWRFLKLTSFLEPSFVVKLDIFFIFYKVFHFSSESWTKLFFIQRSTTILTSKSAKSKIRLFRSQNSIASEKCFSRYTWESSKKVLINYTQTPTYLQSPTRKFPLYFYLLQTQKTPTWLNRELLIRKSCDSFGNKYLLIRNKSRQS